MNITDINNPIWGKLVLGEVNFNPSYLAASLLLWRLKLKLKEKSSTVDVERSKKEIFDLYFKCKDFPNAKADIEAILNLK